MRKEVCLNLRFSHYSDEKRTWTISLYHIKYVSFTMWHPKLFRRCVKGIQIVRRGQERHLKGWKLSNEQIACVFLCAVSACVKKPWKKRKSSCKLCFSYLAPKPDSNVGQRKYINSGACSMGGSDPFQNQNFVTEIHHSWNVLLLVINILSSSFVKKDNSKRETSATLYSHAWSNTRSGTHNSFIAKG